MVIFSSLRQKRLLSAIKLNAAKKEDEEKKKTTDKDTLYLCDAFSKSQAIEMCLLDVEICKWSGNCAKTEIKMLLYFKFMPAIFQLDSQ